MTTEKFTTETKTLQKFIETYCTNKHQDQKDREKTILYKNQELKLVLHSCEECCEMFEYSIQRLQECKYDEKPKCRKCPNPCYEKQRWKKLAKVMRYSGLKLGILKLKNRFFS